MTVTHREDYRSPECVDAWPGAWSCDYDPACSRFPKSCSAGYAYQVPDDHERPGTRTRCRTTTSTRGSR